MNPMIVLAATAALGIDTHWEPLPTGGVEYTIQIESQLFAGLEHGADVTSNVPRQLDVRRYRITTVGSVGKNDAADSPAQTATSPPAAERSPNQSHEPAAGASVGWQPLPHGGSEYIVQVDPKLMGELSDQDLTGKVPPGITVRRFRIKVGSGSLPHEMEPVAENQPPRLRPDDRAAAASAAGSAPQTLTPALDTTPLEVHNEQPATDRTENHTANRQTSVAGAEARAGLAARTDSGGAYRSWPWLMLSLVTLGLLLSVGGNIYLAWIAWDARNRYRGLLSKRVGPSAPT